MTRRIKIPMGMSPTKAKIIRQAWNAPEKSWSELSLSCDVPEVSAVIAAGTAAAPIALVKSIVNVPYEACRWMPAVNELDLRLPCGPLAYMNWALVFVGSIDPPFQLRQFWHIALAVILLFEMPLPERTWIVRFEV